MVKIEERVYGFIKIKGNEPVLITQCFRCFGGLIIFEKKNEVQDDDLPECGLIVYHIPPAKSSVIIKKSTHAILRKIYACLDFYNAKAFYRCGGNIDNEENKKLYEFMKVHLEEPIKAMFPDIQVLGVEPNKDTFYSTILFDENQKVICSQHDGKDLYKKSLSKEA